MPVDNVSFSYDAVVNRKELYRIVTASLAHFDLMHIGFNLMSMWQLGSLEETYGSNVFAFLNADLVVITMLICIGLYYYMMTYGGQPQIAFQYEITYIIHIYIYIYIYIYFYIFFDLIMLTPYYHLFRQSVGWSCVLFAWMVILTLISCSTLQIQIII